MPSLPAEIWDATLDYLCDDKASLYACSLVAREWISACRTHTFKTLAIRVHDKEEDVKFIFNNPLCTIVPFVRKIKIIGHGGTGSWSDEPLAHLPFFPCATDFILSDVEWGYITRSSEEWILAQMAQVTMLTVEKPESYNQLCRILTRAPALSRLHIGGLMEFPSQLHSQLNLEPPHLRELSIAGLSSEPYRAIIDWISPFSKGIERFCITHRGFAAEIDQRTTLSFLQTVGGQLKHLTLQVSYVLNAHIRESLKTTLSTLQQLETVSFGQVPWHNLHAPWATDDSTQIAWISDLQGYIISLSLRALSVKLSSAIFHTTAMTSIFAPLDTICDSNEARMTPSCRLRIEFFCFDTSQVHDYYTYIIGVALPRLQEHKLLDIIEADTSTAFDSQFGK